MRKSELPQDEPANGSLEKTTICVCDRLCAEIEGALAVGVSGGADSLALVFLLQKWAKLRGRRLIALTVDHGLRPSSEQEAMYVASLMQKAGIEHHILTWNGAKPQRGIETAAREARYRLLQGWCQANGVRAVFVAHHMRDQAETFLMRLQRGSGVDGLSGMAAVSRVGGLIILRPLLGVMPEELRAYLRARQIEWVEDESNQSDDFLRVRVRKLLPLLAENLGLSVERLAATAETLRRSKDYIDEQLSQIMRSEVQQLSEEVVYFAQEDWNSWHTEMRFRMLAALLKQIGGTVYPPRAEDVDKLMSRLSSDTFRSCTLNGCEVARQGGNFWIFREVRDSRELGRNSWKDFCRDMPELRKLKIPYRARRLLYYGLLKGKNLFITGK